MARSRTTRNRKQSLPASSPPVGANPGQSTITGTSPPPTNSATKLAEYRAAIICSIIASVLCVYFLDPILSFISRIAITLISVLSQAVLDRIYAQASHLHSHDFAFLLFLLYGFGPSLAIAVSTILRHLLPPLLPAEPVRFILRRHNTIYGKLLPAGIALSIIAFVLTLIGSNWYQLQVISDFEHHIRILAPFLSDQEEEELISEWSSMDSQREFIALRNRLDAIAKSHNVTLPANTVYSPTSL
jgi:hypothetical protein